MKRLVVIKKDNDFDVETLIGGAENKTIIAFNISIEGEIKKVENEKINLTLEPHEEQIEDLKHLISTKTKDEIFIIM